MKCDKCDDTAVLTCVCKRCERETDDTERFHSCEVHQAHVADTHSHIRGRPIYWAKIT